MSILPQPPKAPVVRGVGGKTPPLDVQDAIEAGTTRVTRRVEIWQASDAGVESPWNPDEPGVADLKRLVTGSVTLSYGSEQRRGLDLTLENDDGALRPHHDGLWYDKFIKVFRGVRYQTRADSARICIVDSVSDIEALRFAGILGSLGYYRVTRDEANPSLQHEIFATYTGTQSHDKINFLRNAYNAGKSILTVGIGNTGSQVPMLATTAPPSSSTWGVRQPDRDTPLSGAFVTGAEGGPATGRRPTSLASGGVPVALWSDGGSADFITASIAENAKGGRWLNIQLPGVTGAEPRRLLEAGLLWLQRYTPYREWEVQIGEFAVDNIADQTFPDQVKVTGRDYSKLCVNAKLAQATTYSRGMNVSQLIRALGYQSGIRKDRVPEINATVKTDLSYEADTPRWKIMNDLAASHGYDVFFDNEGYLALKRWQDPVTSAPVWTFETGSQGNLVRLDRTVNDSEIFNHIAVHSSNPSGGMPFFGEAKNTDPQSPTRIAKIGTRFKKFDLENATSDAECQQRARELVKIYGLESFALNFDSLYYPWFDVGDIITVLDPNRRGDEPTRYLLDTLNLTLDLGPMGGSAKRITFVGEPNEQ